MSLLKFLALALPLAVAQNLKTYNINTNRAYVVGISSGGAFAQQLHVAYAGLFKGVGSIAGPPYYCAEDQLTDAVVACMTEPLLISVSSLVSYARQFESQGLINNLANLTGAPVWMYSGTADTVVATGSVKSGIEFYQEFNAKTAFINDIASEHAWITDDYGSSCGTLGTPFINNCGYDAAGAMLTYFSTSPLNAKGNYNASNLLSFSQSPYISSWLPSSVGLADSGYVYVPYACTHSQCGLVLALHGCEQYAAAVGTDFVANSELNAWAETNNLIILYPQTVNTEFDPMNPDGCWDWWGFTSANYATKQAPQPQAVAAMLNAIIGSKYFQ